MMPQPNMGIPVPNGPGFIPQRAPMQGNLSAVANDPNAGHTLGRMPPRVPMGPRGMGGTQMPSLGGSHYATSLGQARARNPMAQAQGATMMQQQMDMGVRPGMNQMGGPSVPAPGGPDLQSIQAEMARRQVGAQLGPRNGALAGYMMG